MWGQQKQQLLDTDKKVFITPSLLDNHKQICFYYYALINTTFFVLFIPFTTINVA